MDKIVQHYRETFSEAVFWEHVSELLGQHVELSQWDANTYDNSGAVTGAFVEVIVNGQKHSLQMTVHNRPLETASVLRERV